MKYGIWIHEYRICQILIYKLFKMITKEKEYKSIIDQAKKTQMLFSTSINEEKKPYYIWQPTILLPSRYNFRSSQQIDTNKLITQQTIHETSKQYTQNEWPKLCIGLVLCEHHQNNQTFYVYGTGTLIHNKIVVTSAQNVYCRRLHKQYMSISFITGVNYNKNNGIYDVKQVHYPLEYSMQQHYENYNFAVLQLYDDLSYKYGYVGWQTTIKLAQNNLISYGYISDNQGSFKLQQITNRNKLTQHYQVCSGNGVFMKGKKNKYCLVGLNFKAQTKKFCVLNKKIREIVNQWTQQTIVDLGNNVQQLNKKILDIQGCKYLSQTNWKHLKRITLSSSKISAQGCKYLSKANWKNLSSINLNWNEIGAQGCKYLTQANWPHLQTINLYGNNIDGEGCKYLIQANWTHLIEISLNYNKINNQGCKYLSQVNWKHLIKLQLKYKNVMGVVDLIILGQLWINGVIW